MDFLRTDVSSFYTKINNNSLVLTICHQANVNLILEYCQHFFQCKNLIKINGVFCMNYGCYS